MPGFCDHPEIYYKVNTDDETSLENWFTDLHLECLSKPRIGLIGSSLFAGWALSAIFIPRMADLYGRKKIFMFSMILELATFIGLYLSKDVNLTTVLMFFFGIASVGRCSISFLYLMELLPASRQVLVGTILHFNNASVGIIGCLYFWKISKNWLWLEVFAGSLALVALIGTFLLMPESPKYLVSKKKYDEARDAINVIAKFG